ncbi:MAG TPA: acyltransferase family protein [Patescibacteria group bacterium]|nr:acyltransferase family protein [Patescibacteria group bacterium]
MEKKQYTLSADIIRILAAFFVVFSHSTDMFVLWPTLKGDMSWYIIYYLNTLSRVAVPVFVLLSGFLILRKEKTTDKKQFLKRRFSRIFLPLVIWTIVYFWWDAFWGHQIITPQYILASIWFVNLRHLYFLVIILELYLVAPFLVTCMATASRRAQAWLLFGLIMVSLLCAVWANLPAYHFDVTGNIITIFIPYLSYFFAGGYFRSIHISGKVAFLLGICYLLLGFITNDIARGNMSAFIVFNYSPTLFPMSLFFFLALKDIAFSVKYKPYILFIASTTFGIYLLHYLMLDLVKTYFHLWPWQLHKPLALFALLPSLITFTVTFLIVAIGKKLPGAKYIFG